MDYFEILGIKPGVSEKEIKNAFHKLAMKWHPDKNPDNKDAEEKFRKINEAYEFLISHPGYKTCENTSSNSKASNSSPKQKKQSNTSNSNSRNNKNTNSSKGKETKNTSYTRQAKYYSTNNTTDSKKTSYKDPNFDDEEDTKQYSKPDFNTRPTSSYMDESKQDLDMNPLEKGCLITSIIILLIPILFVTCVY